MNRLVINKNLNQKNIFRVLGGSIYKNHHWDIVTTKDELIAYLTQFLPDIISIGSLDNMNPAEVAVYLRKLYRQLPGVKAPKVLCIDAEYREKVKKILQRNKLKVE